MVKKWSAPWFLIFRPLSYHNTMCIHFHVHSYGINFHPIDFVLHVALTSSTYNIECHNTANIWSLVKLNVCKRIHIVVESSIYNWLRWSRSVYLQTKPILWTTYLRMSSPIHPLIAHFSVNRLESSNSPFLFLFIVICKLCALNEKSKTNQNIHCNRMTKRRYSFILAINSFVVIHGDPKAHSYFKMRYYLALCM